MKKKSVRWVFAFLIFIMTNSVLAQDMYGLLMVVKGDVKIIKSDKTTTAAKVGGKVFPQDSVVTGVDSRAKIVMSDRNVINVSPETKMEITKYMNDSKSGLKDVEIKLDQGKVRNNVEQSYDGEKSKFLMKTPTAVAGVRGTQFVTSFDTKTNVSSVVAIRGQVSFTSMSNGKPVGAPVIVSKGEGVTAEAGAPAPAPVPVSSQDLKDLDRETSGVGAKKTDAGSSEGAPKEGVANKEGTGKDGVGKEGTKEGAKEGAANPKGEVGGSGPQQGARDANAGGKEGMNMVDKGDLNPGMARDIKNQAPPLPPATPGFNPIGPRPPQPPPTNNLIRDVIRDNSGRTKLIIQPKTPTPNP